MLLHTPFYLLFLVAVVLVYWALPRHIWRKAWLLAASYAFYAAFDARFAGLLFGLTVVVYWLGRAIPNSPRARLYAWLSVIVNLTVLGLFKYAGFFTTSVQTALLALGITSPPVGLALLLPVGISFYTFQAIAYTTEIYRQKTEPAASVLDFALYLAFFPKLIAGPFVRPRQFLRQLAEPAPRPRPEVLSSALILLLTGLIKKLLIADSLGVLSEVAFRAADLPPGGLAFPTPLYAQGFYLYAFQIYADFSGYTDIARASAALIGFDLPENFRQPYLAPTMAEFWNRWHMTLTQWFREYLFFPISRALLARTNRQGARGIQLTATLITMLLIGLWHGAAWTFVAWGLWHGALLSVERLLQIKPAGRWSSLVYGVVTFHLVGVGWVLFRASSFASAARYLAGLVAFEQMGWLPHYLASIVLATALVFGIDSARAGRWAALARVGPRWKSVLTTAALVVLCGLALLGFVRGAEARPFIYGQF